MLVEVHPPIRPLLLYVLSMSLCRSRVRFLAVTGYLFFLRWLRVYIGLRFLRGIGFDWNYYNFITSHSSFPPLGLRSPLRSEYILYKLI
jgi:hypothetical protein